MVFVYTGALIGPLAYSGVLALGGSYRIGYALFAVVPLIAAFKVRAIRRNIRHSAASAGEQRS